METDLDNIKHGRWGPDRLQRMEDEINHLDQMESRIKRLEKKLGEDP
jgi:hypothetical protein